MKLTKIIIAVAMLLAVQSANLFAQQPPPASNGCVSGNCVNGRGKKVYDNGNIYEGDFVNGKKEGQGTFTFKYGGIYIGQFANDARNGKGKNFYANGEFYEGDFLNDKKEGQGILTFKNGETYTGQFANDTYNGKGKLTVPNDEIYEGDFVNGKKNGKGKIKLSNGNTYEGNYVADKFEGQGTYTFPNGSYYVGEWKNDQVNGYAKFYDKATNTVQEGIWKDNVFIDAKAAATTPPKNSDQCVSGNCVNGKGKLIYGDVRSIDDILLVYVSAGDTYEGDFVNGKRQGKGILTGKDGDVYEGDWVNDFQEGEGTLAYKNGNVYTGQFALNGSVKGKLKYANSDLYEGEFTSGARMGPTGQGTIVTKNGDVYQGRFTWGILGGKVIIKYASGDIYEGGFDNGKRIGQGTYTYKNGNYYSGEWKDNKPHGSGKQYIKAADKFREGIWKDGVYVGASNSTVANPNSALSETAALLRDTLNGKFGLLGNTPLTYKLTKKKTGETLLYKIEFINDGGKLAFKWKETTNNEQSEKLIITENALASADKYVNFFTAKSALASDKEIAFILSQALYKDLKAKKEISLNLGNGLQRMTFVYDLTASTGTYTKKRLKTLYFLSDDRKTTMQILDDPVCPLIVAIDTPEYKLDLEN